MHLRDLHPWDLPPCDAMAVQRQLATQLHLESGPAEVRLVLGLDMALDGDDGVAAAVLLRLPDLEVVEQHVARAPMVYPYIPGLLSFREIPILGAVLAKVRTQPDVVMCDGMGTIHPRGFGLACHLGLLLDLPTLGVGKSPYYGDYTEPGPRRGDSTLVLAKGETIGATLRTRDRVKPVYVSPGHRMDLATAIRLVMQTSSKYRLPHPTRLADRAAARGKVATRTMDR